MKSLPFWILAICVLPAAQAAVLGYTENFDTVTPPGDTVPPGWTEGGAAGAANATIVPYNGGQGYQFTISASTSLYSRVSITDAPSSSFVMKADFTITAMASSPADFSNINMVALANTTDLGSSGYRITYNIGPSSLGRLTLGETGTTGLTSVTSTTGLTPTIGAVYTMTLSGVFADGAYNFTATLSDGSNEISVTATDSSARIDGTNFGFRNASNNAANSQTVIFDNFQVLVPEPHGIALFSLGAVTLMRRRRAA